MAIGGEKREPTSSVKKVGLFEGKIIAVNPSPEKFKEITGHDLKEDSKLTEYLGVNEKTGANTVRLDFWIEAVKTGEKFKMSFFLENRERENNDMTKKQYINDVGFCTWADIPANLPKWFTGDENERSYRVANIGEEDLMTFMQMWLRKLDLRNKRSTLELDFKKLIKGYVSEITSEIDGEWCRNVLFLATIYVKEQDGEVKERQNIYNKAFLAPEALANFRLVNYDDPKILENLRSKKTKDLKYHERFVVDINKEYGCRDFFILKDLQEYAPEMNITASDKTFEEDDPEY